MRSQDTLGLHFMPKLNQEKNGVAPLYVRITVNKKRIYLSLKRKVEVTKWDQFQSKLKGHSAGARQLNDYINQTNRKLLEVHKQLIDEQKIITASAIKARYLGVDDIFKKLSDLLNYHKVHMKTVLKAGTLKNYTTTDKYVRKFLKVKMNVEDIYLKQINYRFITDFEYFLRTYKSKSHRPTPSNNGVMKHLERLKKLMNLAQKLEWVQKDPFAKFSLKFDRVERDYLSEEELTSLINLESDRITLNQTRDVFIFACYTGLSWIDVKNLNQRHIVKGIDGSNWIYSSREKTDTPVKIPILPMAQNLIDLYSEKMKDSNFILPVYSNQKTNKYLKEIAKQLKFKKRLTFHVARHTFATTVTLSNGVPIETVSKLLGHTKLSTTQIYARVIERKVSDDMKDLRKKLTVKNIIKKDSYKKLSQQ
ncbi:site-specific integrase [Croceibacter atlanticus]|uniref:site-specific integrase n=1 Tax=Croceibacter atlanticus TaxID=313588 RepID=UPI001C5D5A92|nr:site-specific integrase [Croceibacter atlanticus]MBW4970766.1 site-specific integrase [Croceibacter atlanticus]